jgi:hypothetical protein
MPVRSDAMCHVGWDDNPGIAMHAKAGIAIPAYDQPRIVVES